MITRPTGFHGNTSPAGADGGHTAAGSPGTPSGTSLGTVGAEPAAPSAVAPGAAAPGAAAPGAAEPFGAGSSATGGAACSGAVAPAPEVVDTPAGVVDTAAGRRQPTRRQPVRGQPERGPRRAGRGMRAGVSLVPSATSAASASPVSSGATPTIPVRSSA